MRKTDELLMFRVLGGQKTEETEEQHSNKSSLDMIPAGIKE